MNIKNIIMKLWVALAFVGLTACEEDLERADVVSLQATDLKLEVDPTVGDASKEFHLFTSNKVGSDKSYTLTVNDELTTANSAYFSVPNSVTIPANSDRGAFSVQSGIENVGGRIVLDVASTSDDVANSQIVITIKEKCLENALYLSLVFDGYPEETYWEIYDSSFQLVTGVGAGTYTGLTTAGIDICLPSGDYTFVIFDAFGDGMYDGTTEGNYILKLVEDYSELGVGTGQSFEQYATHEFTIQ